MAEAFASAALMEVVALCSVLAEFLARCDFDARNQALEGQRPIGSKGLGARAGGSQGRDKAGEGEAA